MCETEINEVEAEGLRKDRDMRGRVFGRGEANLRIARRKARRDGDKELVALLDIALANPETAAIVGTAIEDETGGGLFRAIWEWIIANPEDFRSFLEFIIGLFTGLSAAELKTAIASVIAGSVSISSFLE